MEPRTATVRVPGTCGELVQGARDGVNFLVSCPIDRFATITVVVTSGEAEVSGPADAPKASRAAEIVLDHFGCRTVAVAISIDSPLPRSKGFGSSTADVAGVIAALALALGRPLPPAEIGRLATRVEPSDSSMLPGLAAFDHRTGRCLELLGPPPPMDVVALDFGGEVDTLAFNAQDWSAVLRVNEPMVAEGLSLVSRGIVEGRAELVARGATLSAEANQALLSKPALSMVTEFAVEHGGLGVCVGHSGTIIGVLTAAGNGAAMRIATQARAELPGLESVMVSTVVEGGCRVQSIETVEARIEVRVY